LEFEDHRPLYDWVRDHVDVPSRPQQIEFARLNLTHTVMSKRKLLQIVEQRMVAGWDDPRLPTLKGLRRRGYTPAAIRGFCEHIGVAKREATVEMALLEHFIREDLNRHAPRVMAVLHPLRVVIENYPEGRVEELDAVNNPEDAGMGTRKVPFSRVVYIEQEDFREVPPKKFFRLSPGQEVRLRYAYIIKCTGLVKDHRTGEVIEVRCTYDPDTRSGSSQEPRKVKGTLHWVSAAQALPAEVRLYEPLLSTADPSSIQEERDWTRALNPNSLERLTTAVVEPSLSGATPGARYQFERQGYFCVDPDSADGRLVFNRTVPLRDTWAKIQQREG
jgi:glutaminyl-tRNA synthetase